MLEIAKFPSYLSPSSYMMIKKQPAKFYMQRMAPNPWPYEESGLAAACGSGFDARVKTHFCKKLGNSTQVLETVIKGAFTEVSRDEIKDMSFYDAMFHLNVGAEYREEIRPVAEQLFKIYMKFLEIVPTELDGIEIYKYHRLRTPSGECPLYMRLDATRTGLPFDWKVQGYGSKSGASPKPKYMFLYDNGKLKTHKDYSSDLNFDAIDLSWATQLCMYGWGMGRPMYVPFKAYIDAVIVRPTSTRVARYEGWISEEFQHELAEDLIKTWLSLRNGQFLLSLPRDRSFVEMQAEGERWF